MAKTMSVLRPRLLALSAAFVTAESFSPKRGYVADDCKGRLCNGNALLNAAWYYAYNPSDPYGSSPSFVPMHWCLKGQSSPLPSGTNATFLLGYNEPNVASQCNLSPAAAASAWGAILKGWGGGATQLVSPATAGNGFSWLDAFLGNCSKIYGERGCQIKYIAVHYYSCTPEATMSYLKQLHTRYGLPVWLTEFSCGDSRENRPEDDHLTFMRTIFPLLDAAPYVYRYAWMSGSGANRGLLTGDPGSQTLTSLGTLFKSL